MAAVILGIGALVFLAHLFSIWFTRTRVPDVLMLILLGLLLGPVAGIVRVEDLGKVGGVMSTIALVVILFEGGMVIDLTSLAQAFRPTIRITLATFVITALLGAAVGRLAFELPLSSAAILGATVGGTGSAVVIPMVRGLKAGERTATILILESALTDVLCIVVTVGLLAAAQTGDLSPFRMLGTILAAMLFAALLGVLGATAWLRVLDVVRRLPNTLFATVAFVFLVYGVTELLGFSGAIAALAFGITLTNHERIGVDRLARLRLEKLATLSALERDFFAEVGFLLKTFFFVYLGLSIRFADPAVVLVALLGTVTIFLARVPVAMRLCDRDTPRRDVVITSIMVPKALAAAVLASLPAQAGLPGGEAIRDSAFAIVFFSIILTAVLAWAADRPPLRGFYDAAFAAFPAEAGQAPPRAVDAPAPVTTSS